ncbi:MAG: ABC transporter related [uncultured Arthrobacter sp.]|uniref:ABC transporter related n=1 Tax=uncultured Arthrobacter sp. TaxID=114050 RepID=A0A6J4HAB7_9MICC|nr:ABC transporter ATP-binding protein [uncultured Arthrobacter sp.]CAA9217917.1 MAG: ABC transporter related [uncultured Arthrobacter sp.]
MRLGTAGTRSRTPAPDATTERSAISLRGVGKDFRSAAGESVALDSVDLDIDAGDFVCLLGQSGCGKSTLLNLIAGLDSPSRGSIDVGGRRVGMMFQDANLFPWLTVRGNIELALRLSGVPAREFGPRVDELLETVRLPRAASMRPHELSGGMRQRVALARTLAQDCSILLMDEPFAALDAITRDAMHDETERIWLERELTIVFVTHNVRESARLGNRVLVMAPDPGRIDSELRIGLQRPRRMEDPGVADRAAELHRRLSGRNEP